MLKPTGYKNLRAVVFLPVALFLWPLVSYNYYQRRIGNLPDQWYWADEMLFVNGWYVA